MPRTAAQLAMLKSLPGAPKANVFNKKQKLCSPTDKEASSKKRRDAQLKVWRKRKKEGWCRRIEQRA